MYISTNKTKKLLKGGIIILLYDNLMKPLHECTDSTIFSGDLQECSDSIIFSSDQSSTDINL